MKFGYTPKFKSSFKKFSGAIQQKFAKQAEFLLVDIRHPSLHAKKYYEKEEIWQARVDRNVRFYFLIQDDTYVLLDIKQHPK
jgi:mRNA-degrading endonuclease RelE of RelBE toxin-antitoxin system